MLASLAGMSSRPKFAEFAAVATIIDGVLVCSARLADHSLWSPNWVKHAVCSPVRVWLAAYAIGTYGKYQLPLPKLF